MKSFFLNTAKGALIGIACLIPGVSGGTLAIILNVYDKLLNAVSNITKDFKKSLLTLLPFAIGILLGIAALIIPLQWALANFPFPTATLFVALIIGQLPSLYRNVQGYEKATNFLISAIPLILVIGLCAINLFTNTPDVTLINIQWYMYIVLFLVGFLASATLVVPGVSGSMVLMLVGFYKPILDVCAQLLHFENIFQSILILIPFGIGIIIGFYFMSKFISFCLAKWKIQTFFAIIGFIVGSLAGIYMQVDYSIQIDLIQIILSIVLFVGGIVGSYSLDYLNRKYNKKLTEEESKDESR